MVASIMAGPFFTQNLTTESVLVLVASVTVGIFCIGTVLGNFEPMGCGTQTNDGPGPVQIVDEMLHLTIRPILEAGENHHQVGLGKFLYSGHVTGSRLNFALCINPEDDRTLEAMTLGENPGESRKSFFRPVFVIACNEDNALAHPKTFFPDINQWSLTKDGKGEKSAKAGQD